MTDQEIVDVGRDCMLDEAYAVQNTASGLGESFVQAVKSIFACKGKTVVTGVGKSGHIGRKIAATLASTGTPAFFVNPLDAFHGDLGMIQSDDVVLAISYSGSTEELLRLLPLLRERGIHIIGISRDDQSSLAKYSSCHISIPVDHEGDPLGLAPTSSTTATLALGDAIACALVRLRGFTRDDFAKYHPGGTLGYMLNSTPSA